VEGSVVSTTPTAKSHRARATRFAQTALREAPQAYEATREQVSAGWNAVGPGAAVRAAVLDDDVPGLVVEYDPGTTFVITDESLWEQLRDGTEAGTWRGTLTVRGPKRYAAEPVDRPARVARDSHQVLIGIEFPRGTDGLGVGVTYATVDALYDDLDSLVGERDVTR
jgi:hypothetical protein